MKYFVSRDSRATCPLFLRQNAEGVHAHVSKCWRGTCSCVKMLKGYMGNKRLASPALIHCSV